MPWFDNSGNARRIVSTPISLRSRATGSHRALDAGDERAFSAGDDEADPLAGPGEGRHQLGAVLDRHATRGTRAEIHNASMITQRRVGRFGRRSDRGKGMADVADPTCLRLPHNGDRRTFEPRDRGVGSANRCTGDR
jgi:hypothetical protein